MGQVIEVDFAPRRASGDALGAMAASFAQHRRGGDDVFWLKENAEFLNVLDCSGITANDSLLAEYQPFYRDVAARLAFFPQYYRFLLSLTLDLEDLGMPGTTGQQMAEWIDGQGLVEAELSDLQRAEAQRLMRRRGVDGLRHDPALETRLRAFCARPATFALPNKKAAYELTHAVYYLSNYGRVDPQMCAATTDSLLNAGLLAFLDQNADLLAEICVALRCVGQEPPAEWERWVDRFLAGCRVIDGHGGAPADAYHEFLVCGWSAATRGAKPFDRVSGEGQLVFCKPAVGRSALRELSQSLYGLRGDRSADWSKMRDVIEQSMSHEAYDLLSAAQASTDRFDAFFEGFARASQIRA